MSSLNLNKVVLVGRLTADVELKQSTSGVAVCSFTLAVNRRYAKEGEQSTDFISVVAWRDRAEFITRYFRKGSAICITGSIQTRSWKDKQGNNRYSTEVVVDEAMFVDSKSDVAAFGGAETAAPVSAVPPAINTVTAPNFGELSTDDALPF